jgi:hypothetical protein
MEAFTTKVMLGEGWCVSTYEDHVTWVMREKILVRLTHKGVVVDEMGRYEGLPDEAADESDGLRIAMWTADALKIDGDSALAVEAWRLRYVEPMVMVGKVMAKAPAGMTSGSGTALTWCEHALEALWQWELAWTSKGSDNASGIGDSPGLSGEAGYFGLPAMRGELIGIQNDGRCDQELESGSSG